MNMSQRTQKITLVADPCEILALHIHAHVAKSIPKDRGADASLLCLQSIILLQYQRVQNMTGSFFISLQIRQ